MCVVHCDWDRVRLERDHDKTFSILDMNPSDLFLNVLQQAVQVTQTPLFSYQGQPKNKKQETHEQEKDSRLFSPRLGPSLGNWAEPPQWSLLCPPTHLPRRVQLGDPSQAPTKCPEISVNRGPPLASEENVFSSPEPLEGGHPSWPQFRSLGGG